jgi:hypothetical protein
MMGLLVFVGAVAVYMLAMALLNHRTRLRRQKFCDDCGEPIALDRTRCDACDWVIDFHCFDRASQWLRSLDPEIAAIRNELRKAR